MTTVEYTTAMQELFAGMMLSEPQLYTRVSNIINDANFDKSIKPAITFMREFSEAHNSLPDYNMIKAATGVDIQPVEHVSESHVEWFLDEFEKFTRRQELERAILKSADLLEKGDYGPVEALIKAAVQISLTKNMGTDYFADPKKRLLAIKNNNGQISTGWPVLDSKLYGGFNRGELQIFAGGSGSGKSLFMQNLSVNWSQAKLNGVYISLELSEELCAWRIDSMMTDTAAKMVFRDIDDVAMKVGMIGKKSGRLYIKYMPAQSTVNDIRAYVKSLEIETGVKVDFLCIDYLDLLMPVSAKVSPSDLFIKDKYVSEEIRNLAKELNVLLVTASQLNRAAVEETEFDHSHISGGISKINTADNVFGIFTSRSMRERGMYQIQLMKTRSSSGVGQKIDLSFNQDSLRIFDDGDTTGTAQASEAAGSILNKIRTNSVVVPGPSGTTYNPVIAQSPIIDSELQDEPEQKRVMADVQSAKLKSMLNQIKSGKLGS
jgi:KaiC/GvpD/RAD55 family RecA-like ATPase